MILSTNERRASTFLDQWEWRTLAPWHEDIAGTSVQRIYKLKSVVVAWGDFMFVLSSPVTTSLLEPNMPNCGEILKLKPPSSQCFGILIIANYNLFSLTNCQLGLEVHKHFKNSSLSIICSFLDGGWWKEGWWYCFLYWSIFEISCWRLERRLDWWWLLLT